MALAVAAVSAAPGALLAGYTAPVVAPSVVTAHSSQVIARNYNGLAAPLVAAAPVAVAAPLHAAPVAVAAHYKAAPLAVAAPLAAHVAAPYAAAPYYASPAYYL